MKEFQSIEGFLKKNEDEYFVSETIEMSIIKHMQDYALDVKHREMEAYNQAETVVLNS